jgi:ubiquinone/menaquinone biosynthesis C-methylase UbiE
LTLSDQPHSKQDFTASRALWWNEDYLELLARRHGLRQCRNVLELGAGVGHWTAILLDRCAPDAQITAIDREQVWVAALAERFGRIPGFHALRADVADLPELAGSFDLVTCQTLLLHIADVPGLLRTARRLLAPGGLLLAVEPNNFANRLQVTPDSGLTSKQYGELAAMWWAYEIGREKLGFGQEWIAESLPRMIVEAGFEQLAIAQNDRTWAIYPPYRTEEQATLLAEEDDATAADSQQAERAEIRRYTEAGGLDAADFERGWASYRELVRLTQQAIAAGTHSAAIAGHLSIFTARAPAATARS